MTTARTDDQVVKVEQLGSAVEIVGYRPPASLQSRRSKKGQASAISAAIASDTDQIFLGDVSVSIEWLVEEEDRYLSDAPDIDNILKPILDALCGPEGILIDDVQVQQIDVRWLNGWNPETGPPFQYRVRVAAVTGSFLWRAGLTFVRVGDKKKVCYPIPRQPGLDDELHEKHVASFAHVAHRGWQEPRILGSRVMATPFLPSRVEEKFPVRDLSEIPVPDGLRTA